jgi:glycine betaine/proline transport system ATP-binding protein
MRAPDMAAPDMAAPSMAAPKIAFDRVSIVFGDAPERALPLMDRGMTREQIQTETGQILGVHDCALEVMEGEIVVLMGLSGSGKSTLIRAVNGLNPIARGQVTVRDGEWSCVLPGCGAGELKRLRRECVSMVFQQFGLLPWRTVLDNVAFGLELAGVPAAERRRRALAQLELVRLEAWAERKVHQLSGGMQQRVGLARAFATEAPILLMDEPFSALDPLIRAKLQDELLEFQQKLGRTILFVSHDLDEALKIGNRIAIMEGGRIVQLDTPQNIVLRPSTDYVAEFVAHMNPLNVLRAAEVMRPIGPGGPPVAARVMPATTALRDLIRAQCDDPAPIVIAGEAGPVGIVSPQAILDALLREHRPQEAEQAARALATSL